MSKVTKQLDFSGEKIFIGIDVHLKSWQVSIFAQERLLKISRNLVALMF